MPIRYTQNTHSTPTMAASTIIAVVDQDEPPPGCRAAEVNVVLQYMAIRFPFRGAPAVAILTCHYAAETYAGIGLSVWNMACIPHPYV